jgi:hypothetical protein
MEEGLGEIALRMTLEENRVCSAACVAYLGVQFHAVEKRRNSAADRRILDALFDRLVDERREREPTPSEGAVADTFRRCCNCKEHAGDFSDGDRVF